MHVSEKVQGPVPWSLLNVKMPFVINVHHPCISLTYLANVVKGLLSWVSSWISRLKFYWTTFYTEKWLESLVLLLIQNNTHVQVYIKHVLTLFPGLVFLFVLLVPSSQTWQSQTKAGPPDPDQIYTITITPLPIWGHLLIIYRILNPNHFKTVYYGGKKSINSPKEYLFCWKIFHILLKTNGMYK